MPPIRIAPIHTARSAHRLDPERSPLPRTAIVIGALLLGAGILGLWLRDDGGSATAVPAPALSATTSDTRQPGTPATTTTPTAIPPSATLPAAPPTAAPPTDSPRTAATTGGASAPTSDLAQAAPGGGTVALTPAAAAQASREVADGVVRVLETYASGINRREFASAYAAYSAREKGINPYDAWRRALSTSQLAQMTVVGLRGSVAAPGSGPVTADVTFTSHQSESAAPAPGETCSRWSLTYTLLPDESGTGYLIDDAQPTRGPGHARC